MNKLKDIFGNIGNVKASTWVRFALMVITVVNMILTAIGKPPIHIDNEELYMIMSVVASIVVGIVNFWKNNSFTGAAIAADEYLHNQGFANEDPGTDLKEEQ